MSIDSKIDAPEVEEKNSDSIAEEIETTVQDIKMEQKNSFVPHPDTDSFIDKGVVELEVKNADGEYVSKKCDKDKLFAFGKTKTYHAQSNLDISDNSGVLVDIDYFNKTTISGVLDYTSLAEIDDTELGFKSNPKMEKDESYRDDSEKEILLHKIYEKNEMFKNDNKTLLSEREIADLSGEEKDALTYFTSNSYAWLNEALFEKEVKKGDEKDAQDSFKNTIENTFSTLSGNHEKVKIITKKLDEALSKGPKIQRTVYRAVSSSASFFKVDGDPVSAKEWVDHNLEAGKEIVFDGYQSTTAKPQSLNSYATNDGIIYEIITPEGINVRSISEYDEEEEVLLPRQARYTVSSITHGVSVKNTDYGRYDNMTLIRLIAINSQGEVLDGTNSDPVEPITDEYFEELF